MRTWKRNIIWIVLLGFIISSCTVFEDKIIAPYKGELELEFYITPGPGKANFSAMVCGLIDNISECPTFQSGNFFWEDEYIDESLPEYGEIRFYPGGASIHIYLHESHYNYLTDPQATE